MDADDMKVVTTVMDGTVRVRLQDETSSTIDLNRTMPFPTREWSLAQIPASVKVIPASEATGFRKRIFDLAKPAAQCFGSVMVIDDDLWLRAAYGDIEACWDFWSITQHELRHHYQSRGWRLPFFVIGYLLLPLPIGFSFRALFELGGYRQSLRCFAARLDHDNHGWRDTSPFKMTATSRRIIIEREAKRLAEKFRAKFYWFMGWFLPLRFWTWALMRGLSQAT